MSGIDDLPPAQEVEAPPERRGQGLRLLAVLVGAGILIGAIVAGFTGFATSFVQTEAGLCRVLPAPCTSLPLSSVEHFAGVDLPDGTTVEGAYSQEGVGSLEFRAEVVLPQGSSPTPLRPVYSELEGDWSESVPAVRDAGLTDVTYWYREIELGNSVAAQGVDEGGRTVILFDTRR